MRSHALTLLVTLGLLACGDPATDAGKPTAQTESEQFLAMIPKWGKPGRLDPASLTNRYENAALGVRIIKPEGWVWLPETSLPDFAKRPDGSLRQTFDPGEWGDPIHTPLIAMASVANPQRNRDVEVHLMAKPQTMNDMQMLSLIRDPARLLSVSTHPQRKTLKVAEEARAVPVGGLDGAVMRYRPDQPNTAGAASPSSERVWLASRGPYLFYLHAWAPESATPAVQHQIQAIFESLEIEP